MEKIKTSIFLIILLCILVAVAGGGVSYLYLASAHDQETQSLDDQVDQLQTQLDKLRTENKTTATTAASTTPATATPTITPDPTANWKTYSGTYEGITLKYPSTWTFISKPGNPASSEWPDSKEPFDGFTLTSPNNFQIEYITHIGGIGGGCDTGVNCPKIHYYNVMPLTNSGYTNLHLIQLEKRDQDNKTISNRNITIWNPHLNTTVTPKTGQTIEGIFYSLYDDKGSDHTLSQLSGTFTNQDRHLSLGTQQYFDLPDVKEAVEILKTVHFSK